MSLAPLALGEVAIGAHGAARPAKPVPPNRRIRPQRDERETPEPR